MKFNYFLSLDNNNNYLYNIINKIYKYNCYEDL